MAYAWAWRNRHNQTEPGHLESVFLGSRKRLPQPGTLKLGSTRGEIARPYACDFDGLSPKGTQGPVLWALSEPNMRLVVVRIPRAVLWHSALTWDRAVCERYLA